MATGSPRVTIPAAATGAWLAAAFVELGRFAEALAVLPPVRDHEATIEQTLGKGAIAVCYSNLAGIQRAQGDLPGARAGLERAIAVQEQHFAPDHPTFATT